METALALKLDIDFEGHKVRVFGTQDKPEWIASDLGEVLGISHIAGQLKRFSDSEKGMAVCHTPGGLQQVLTVTEAGLYRLILRSNKPEAERFRDWVTHQVLPSIRRNGCYPPPEALACVGESRALVLREIDAIPARVAAALEPRLQAHDARFSVIESKVDCVAANQNRLENKFDTEVKAQRKDFSVRVQTQINKATREHPTLKGKCLYCKIVEVVDSNYEIPIVNGQPVAQYDHAENRNDHSFDNCSLICSGRDSCHAKKHNPAKYGKRKGWWRSHFDSFHQDISEMGFPEEKEPRQKPSHPDQFILKF